MIFYVDVELVAGNRVEEFPICCQGRPLTFKLAPWLPVRGPRWQAPGSGWIPAAHLLISCAAARMGWSSINCVPRRLIALLKRHKIDIVAVCFLHSYANPAHEQTVAEQLRRAGLRVCASHEVLPEYREYERWSTTVLNAYVTPLIDEYLGKLERSLNE